MSSRLRPTWNLIFLGIISSTVFNVENFKAQALSVIMKILLLTAPLVTQLAKRHWETTSPAQPHFKQADGDHVHLRFKVKFMLLSVDLEFALTSSWLHACLNRLVVSGWARLTRRQYAAITSWGSCTAILFPLTTHDTTGWPEATTAWGPSTPIPFPFTTHYWRMACGNNSMRS